jgi:thiol-disulfide isomerase/thioredoxin
MALVSTEQLPLGFYAPHFTLPNVLTNKDFSFSGTYGKKGTLIIFMCNHCPYVIHLIEKISELSRIYDALGISFIGINANDIIAYPQDSPLEMVAFAQKYGFDFSLLV